MRQLLPFKYKLLIIISLSFLQVCAAILFTNQNFDGIQVGVPYTLTWDGADGAVTLGLIYKNISSSPQQSYIIATNINESQFTWTPPDWTSSLFQQKIEAQDDSNLTLTGNFTIEAPVTSTLASSATAKIANAQPTNSTTSIERPPQNELSSAAKIRIGFGICIVVILVIIGVALIFFEHGKRVAARSELPPQPKSPFGRTEHGSVAIELVETKMSVQKEIEEIKEEPSTPLLYKKPKLAVELEGGVMDDKKLGVVAESKEERNKRILSMRSIYELG